MNEHDEKILGQALGRAVESQSTRETPYQQSRLATRISGQGRALPLFRFAAMAAAFVLIVGAGFWLTQLRGLPPGQVGTSPTPTPTDGGVVVTPGPAVELVLYIPNELGLPEAYRIARPVEDMSTPEARIQARLKALEDSGQLGLGGDNNAFPISASVASVRVSGDTATVDYTVPGDDWGDSVSASAGTLALIQQIVYTASEEPGIRQVLLTQNGGQRAIVGGSGLVVDSPLSREDTLPYAMRGSTEAVENVGDPGRQVRLSLEHSVDQVAPGVARVVITVESDERFYIPTFFVEVAQNEPERADGPRGKWYLRLAIEGEDRSGARSVLVDGTPLRSILVDDGSAPSGAPPGCCPTMAYYYIYLDDLRPWRVGLLVDPMRIVVDIGGHPQLLANGTIVYAPQPNATVDRTFTVSGLARHFEANVVWRIRDSGGAVVAQGHTTATIGTSPIWGFYETQISVPASIGSGAAFTLEVIEPDMRDGSDRYLISIPLRVR